MTQNIQLELDHIAADATLLEDGQLWKRVQRLDYLRFVLEMVRQRREPSWNAIREQAEQLQTKLQAANEQLFAKTRQLIAENRQRPFPIRAWFDQFTGYVAGENGRLHVGPDGLDYLWEGVLNIAAFGRDPLPEREADMVHYEPTPARVILDLIDHAHIQPQTVFYDIGSGLGHVPILFHLLTGCPSIGIELEGVYCRFAVQRAALLALDDVAFVEQDARTVDYNGGTIFFLFTPFMGQMLQTVCDRLQQVAQRRIIQVATYGPCSARVAQQPWLETICNESGHDFKLGLYRSLSG